MTVKELKDNLAFYDDDAEVIFEIDCEIEPESITETKYGWHTVYLNSRLKLTFIGTIHGNCYDEAAEQGRPKWCPLFELKDWKET